MSDEEIEYLPPFHLRWHGPLPSDEDVRATLREVSGLLLDGLEKPEELIFHTVFLTADMDGPSVHVWGDPDHPQVFQCQRHDETRWVSLDEWKDRQ
jgi:hypothetical protein